MLRKFFCFLLLLTTSCSAGQQYRNFSIPKPLPENSFLVIGFVGGRNDWNDPKSGIRKLALKLREMELPEVYVETVENRRRYLALQLINAAFDQDGSGKLEDAELDQVRLIVYGESFGGAAVVKLAKELQSIHVPILLTIQVDSVGKNDSLIPYNVKAAANLFQKNGWIIRGEPDIRAEDPDKTQIIGNFQYDYGKKEIDISHIPWLKKIFRVAHTKMGNDPEVWQKVESLIIEQVTQPD
jgi:hypothetical protein